MDKTSKFRLLYIGKLLFELTDEDHYLTTYEIINLLKEKYGIDSFRTTISDDIQLLKDFGMEIESVRSSTNKYHLVSRSFDLPELKLLIDAVESSKFITKKKVMSLWQNLKNLRAKIKQKR